VISLPVVAGLPAYAGSLAGCPSRLAEDPILTIWREWVVSHDGYVHASNLLWEVDAKLAALPREIDIHLPFQGAPVYASTSAEIDGCLGGRPERIEVRAFAKSRRAAWYRKWDGADFRAGYSRAVQAERAAFRRCEELAYALQTTQALSPAGAAAKLQCFVEMNTPVASWRKGLNPDLRRFEEPSWPELRAILGDLTQIAEVSHV
jgi:hypothetical protein